MEDAAGGVADEALDLCGEVCPYTFLKSKLALEELAPGQVLRIIVDNETSARDVPQALHGTGHTVLEVGTPGPGLWTIVVRRGRVSGSEAAPDSGTATVARRTGRVV